jgi:plasmid stabilization system protein ParE
MRVIVHPAAILDLQSATEFYKSQASKELALALVFEFERTVKLISANPELGAEWISTARRIVMRRFPFNVVYRIDSANLTVLAVAHQRRKPGYWNTRK